ncbi:ScbA/BarX family gamma-butyrolactone biosynthesis protein [Streptomyces chitinivorans]
MSEPFAHAPAAQVPARVAQQSVHKLNAAEVLLTGWRRGREDEFVVTARWPEDHAFYTVRDRCHDPLLLCETIRQTFPLLSHEAYGVPLGHALVWDTYEQRLDPGALRSGDSYSDVELRVTVREATRRRGRIAALSLLYDVVRDGLPLATAGSRFTIHSPEVYRRLRRGHGDLSAVRPIPVPAAVSARGVGRADARDVVLAPTGEPHRWQLRVDTDHPVLFDHPVDHVPGMLLLEAARQAAHSFSGRPSACVTAMDVRFHRYAELDAPGWVEVRPAGRDTGGCPRLAVVGSQDGRELFSCMITLDEDPRGPRSSSPSAGRFRRPRRSALHLTEPDLAALNPV